MSKNYDSGDHEELNFDVDEVDEEALVKQRNVRVEKMAAVQEQLAKEVKMRTATEEMLQLYLTGAQRDPQALREVQSQMDSYNSKIKALEKQYDQYKHLNEQQQLTLSRRSHMPRETNSDVDVTLRKSTSVNYMPDSWRYRLSHFRAETVTGMRGRKRPALNIMKGVLQNLTDILTRLNSKAETSQGKLDALNNLVKLIKNSKVEPFQYVEDILKSYHSFDMLCHTTYRSAVVRCLVCDKQSAKAAWQNSGLDIFILRALCRDQKLDSEREQALKLVRAFLDYPDTIQFLPKCIISILLAISEQPDDKYKNLALETLCEIASRDLNGLINAGALRHLFQTLVDPSKLSVEIVIPTIGRILDAPETRAHVHPGIDVEMAISNFTDTYNRGTNQEERLKSCSRSIVGLLKTWPGLIFLSMHGMKSIRCLVEVLVLPYEENKKFLIETLFEIFRISVPKWLPDIVSARAASVTYRIPTTADETDTSQQDTRGDCPGQDRANLVNHHLALVLVIFIECGLIEALVSVIEESTTKALVTRATILVGELLELSNTLLPTSFCVRVHSLPKLFGLAATFDDENLRHLGTWSLNHIDKLNFMHQKSRVNSEKDSGGCGVDAHKKHAQKQIENIKIRIGVQLDDIHFKNLLNDSQVSLGKDYTKWNWDSISELLQGPLLNPKRFEDVVKNTKFIKRLLAFYRPNKHRFSDIKIGKNTARYVQVGCCLFKTVLSNPEGIKFLAENKFFPSLAECLLELDPINGSTSLEPILAKERMEKTLTGEYFTLLSILFKCKEGLDLLHKFNILNSFYHLTELRSRDDLIRKMISCMDYSVDGHPRVILSKVMTSGYKHIRMFATTFIRTLIGTNGFFANWGIRILITQLYDPSIEICEKAVLALDEACQTSANLESLISLRPSLDHLGEIGNPLLFRFMSTKAGFDFLMEIGYVEKELDFWFKDGNYRFVVQVELSIARALYPRSKADMSKSMETKLEDAASKQSDVINVDGYCLPHFYGQVIKTEGGYQLIKSKNHFERFAATIKAAQSEVVPASVMELKAALWAVGNMGSSSRGLEFLDEFDIIKSIVDIAENSSILTLKGTCYYVLGLISKNPQAADILEDYGWNSVSSFYNAAGFCVPIRLDRFLAIPNWTPHKSVPTEFHANLFKSKDAIEVEILKNIGNLSNHILANASSKALNRLKHENPRYFTSMELNMTALRIVSVYHYRLTARRFVQDLFDQVDMSDPTVTAAFQPIDISGKQFSAEVALRQLTSMDSTESLSKKGKKSVVFNGSSSNLNGVSGTPKQTEQLSKEDLKAKKQEFLPRVIVEG